MPARLLEGFHYAGTGFNGVLLVGPSVHRQYQTISPRLHDLTLVAFPVFPGEFSGDEKPDHIDLIRREVVNPLNWKRAPSPQVWLRFKDAVTGVRSTGKKPGLTTEASLLKMLQSMAPAEGSFVEITNFRGEKVTLTTTADGFELTFPRQSKRLILPARGSRFGSTSF